MSNDQTQNQIAEKLGLRGLKFIPDGNARGGNGRNGDWQRVPCISITKGGVSFNNMACSEFGLQDGLTVFFAAGDSPPRLAMKFVALTGEEDLTGGYKVQYHKNPSGSFCNVSSKEIRKMFGFAVGNVYRLYEDSGLVIATLTDRNKARTE